MKKYNGREQVRKGVYLNRGTGELIQMYGRNRILPGEPETGYIKVPGWLAIIGGPFAGLALVMFLPLVGVIGMGWFFGCKAWQGVGLGKHAENQAAEKDEA